MPRRFGTRPTTTRAAIPVEKPTTIARGMKGMAAPRPEIAKNTRKMPASNVERDKPRAPSCLTMLDANVTKTILGALILIFESPSPETRKLETAAQRMPLRGRTPDAVAMATLSGKICDARIRAASHRTKADGAIIAKAHH